MQAALLTRALAPTRPCVPRSRLSGAPQFGRAVLQGGGVLTDAGLYGVVRGDVTGQPSYVPQPLATPIRKGGTKHLHAHLAKLSFVASPETLEQVRAGVRSDQRVLRHLVVKQSVDSDLIPPAPRSANLPEGLLAAVEEVNALAENQATKKATARAPSKAAAFRAARAARGASS